MIAIQDILVKTELLSGEPLNRPDIYLKMECNQISNSFKARGVVNYLKNRIALKGLITYTTGNHGISVAIIASKLGLPAVIVSSKRLSNFKRKILSELGACVEITDLIDVDDAIRFTKNLAEEKGYEFIPLFKEQLILDGYKGIVEEITSQLANQFDLYIPVGSGSLALSCIQASSAGHRDIRCYGVEPAIFQRLTGTVQQGSSSSCADCLSINKIPEGNYEILDKLSGKILVSETEIMKAVEIVKRVFQVGLEAGGAIGLAAALKTSVSDRAKVVLVTGKNSS